jgi:ABC-type antimicrobial peptide transport system permease subunit
LQEFLNGDQRALILTLWAASLFFLLLATGGVINVLLAQGTRRRRELALRLALGASRLRLIRQLLTETTLLVCVAAVAGAILSVGVSRWLQAALPDMPHGPVFVPATLGVIVAVAFAVTCVAGLIPAFVASRAELNTTLKGDVNRRLEVRRSALRPSLRELGAGLQLAVALALLLSTTLLVRSLAKRFDVPLGIETRHIVTFSVAFPRRESLIAARERFFEARGFDPWGSYGPRQGTLLTEMHRALEPEQRSQALWNVSAYAELLTQLPTIQGVRAAGIMWPAPFTAEAARALQNTTTIYKSNPKPGRNNVPRMSVPRGGRATSAAFDLLGIRFIAGRSFSDQEIASERAFELAQMCRTCELSPGASEIAADVVGVAVINQTAAERFWPGENPVGQLFYDSPSTARTVVGVIADFQQSPHGISAVMPAVYYPFHGTSESGSFIVKLGPEASPQQVTHAASQLLRRLDPVIPAPRIQDLDTLTTETLRGLRTSSVLLSCFSAVSIIVAGLGMYALAMLTAEARRREIGIRIALGATVGTVRWLTLRRSIGIGLVALPFGFLLGWAVSRQLAHLLFQVGASDPVSYVASGGLLMGVVFLAGGMPAVRATSGNPVAALWRD